MSPDSSQTPLPAEPVPPPIVCRNCGHPIHHHYCPNCGQHKADHNHSLWQFVLEFTEEFVRLDSKFVRTLVPLCCKPGFLTKEWVAGRRVRYITPLKMYLTLSAICFLLISLHPNISAVSVDPDKKDLNTVVHSVTTKTAEKIASKEQDRDEEDPKQQHDWFDTMVRDSVGKLGESGPEGDAMRRDFGGQFLSSLSAANLVLLPIFALIFKMLYIRRSRFYVEHLVFALHYYAFVFLGLSLCLAIPKPYVIVPVSIWMVCYLPIAVVRNYQQGIIKTFFKCFLFGMFYAVAVGITYTCVVFVAAKQVVSKVQPAKAATSPIVPSTPAPGAGLKKEPGKP